VAAPPAGLWRAEARHPVPAEAGATLSFHDRAVVHAARVLRILLILAAAVLLLAGEPVTAPTAQVQVGPNPSAVAFFEAKIRPVLSANCYECHAGAKKRGGLHVDSLAALLSGGNDGAALIPGDGKASLLLHSLRWEGDPDLNMPPKQQLPAAVIHDFERWVEIGAPWPDAAPAGPAAAAPAAPRPPLLGRIHPIVVHMPIACLLLAVLAELLVLFRGPAWQPATALLVTVGVFGAAGAVLSGTWLEGGQDPRLIDRHDILGWLTLCGAVVASGMLIVMRWVPLRRWLLLAVLILTALLAGATGHIGG